MDALVESLEAFSEFSDAANLADAAHVKQLQALLSSILTALDALDLDCVGMMEKDNVVVPALSTIAMLLEMGRQPEYDLNEISTMIWRVYGKIIKKYSLIIDSDTSKQFLRALTGHTLDGLAHVRKLCKEGNKNAETFNKVLSFFAQRLALSLIWLQTGVNCPDRAKAFQVLVAYYGLQHVATTSRKISTSTPSVSENALKMLSKILRVHGDSLSPASLDGADSVCINWKLLWSYHNDFTGTCSGVDDLKNDLETHHGFLQFFLQLFQSWIQLDSVRFKAVSSLNLACVMKHLLFHCAALIMHDTPEDNPSEERNGLQSFNHASCLGGVAIVGNLLTRLLRESPSKGLIIVDWLAWQACNGEERGGRISDLVCSLCRQMLVSALAGIHTHSSTLLTQLVPHIIGNVVILFEHTEMLARTFHSPHLDADLVAVCDDMRRAILDTLLALLSCGLEGIADQLMQRIKEAFLFHLTVSPSYATGKRKRDSSSSNTLPYLLLESLLQQFPFAAIMHVNDGNDEENVCLTTQQTIVQKMLQQALTVLQHASVSVVGKVKDQTASNGNSGNQKNNQKPVIVSFPAEALSIALVSALMPVASIDASVQSTFSQVVNTFTSGSDSKGMATHLLQTMRTLTAQLELYAKDPDSFHLRLVKVRGWIRAIGVIVCVFAAHPTIPGGVQRILAECLSRLCLCTKVFLQVAAVTGSSSSTNSSQVISPAWHCSVLTAAMDTVTHFLRILFRSTQALSPPAQSEVTFALQELSQAIKNSSAKCVPIYQRFGAELLALVSQVDAESESGHSPSGSPVLPLTGLRWFVRYLDSSAGGVLHSLIQLSMENGSSDHVSGIHDPQDTTTCSWLLSGSDLSTDPILAALTTAESAQVISDDKDESVSPTGTDSAEPPIKIQREGNSFSESNLLSGGEKTREYSQTSISDKNNDNSSGSSDNGGSDNNNQENSVEWDHIGDEDGDSASMHSADEEPAIEQTDEVYVFEDEVSSSAAPPLNASASEDSNSGDFKGEDVDLYEADAVADSEVAVESSGYSSVQPTMMDEDLDNNQPRDQPHMLSSATAAAVECYDMYTSASDMVTDVYMYEDEEVCDEEVCNQDDENGYLSAESLRVDQTVEDSEKQSKTSIISNSDADPDAGSDNK